MKVSPEEFERFFALMERGPNCWTIGAAQEHRYSRFYLENGERGKGLMGAHRVAYFLAYGKLDGGLDIDHLCHNPRCVRPSHLDQVTRGENVERGRMWNKRGRHGICCKQGHPTAIFRKEKKVKVKGQIRTRYICLQCHKDARKMATDKKLWNSKGASFYDARTCVSIFCVNGHRRTKQTAFYEKNSIRCRVCRASQSKKAYQVYARKNGIPLKKPLTCRKGHLYTDDNTLIFPSCRRCKICYKAAQLARPPRTKASKK